MRGPNRDLANTVNVPAPFDGPVQQRALNRDSHTWLTATTFRNEVEGYCGSCGCEPHEVAANYPCGAEVPRMEVPLR